MQLLSIRNKIHIYSQKFKVQKIHDGSKLSTLSCKIPEITLLVKFSFLSLTHFPCRSIQLHILHSLKNRGSAVP